MTHVQVPVAQAMVVCDAIHADPSTGKFFLLGTFDGLFGTALPIAHPIMCVYVTMTDGMGLVSLRFQIIDAAEEREPIYVEEFQIPWQNPLQVIQHVVILQGVQFAEAGAYNFQLKSGDTLIIEKRLMVHTAEKRS